MILSTPDMYKNDLALIEHLSTELIRGRLAIILGAGVSKPFGLPDWDTLIEECCAQKKVLIPKKNRDNLRLAEYVRNRCSDDSEYYDIIKNALYKNVKMDLKNLRNSPMLQALGILLMKSRRGYVNTVLTYNFDDLLEYYLESNGKTLNVVTKTPSQNSYEDVSIFHPHGFLPNYTSNYPLSEYIIFDRLSYAERVAELNLWNNEIFNILNKNTCLFFGLSFSDFDLDADIYKSKKEHPTISAGYAYWGIRFSTRSKFPETDNDETNCMHNRGIFLKFVDDYQNWLPEFIYKIAQKAAQIIREHDI